MASESQRASAMTPLMGVPSPSPRRRLLAAGFAEPDRALRALDDRALADLLAHAGGGSDEAGDLLVTALGATADPDLALLSLLRLAGACAQEDDPTAANGLVEVLRAVVGERFRRFVGGGGVGLVGGAAEDLLERREGAALGGRLVGGVGGGRGGSLGAGARGVGRHVGQLLAVRAMQVFTRVIRHAPIVSGSCRLCRNGTRKWVG